MEDSITKHGRSAVASHPEYGYHHLLHHHHQHSSPRRDWYDSVDLHPPSDLPALTPPDPSTTATSSCGGGGGGCRRVLVTSRRGGGLLGRAWLAAAGKARRTVRFLLVFFVLLVLAESLLNVAVLLGYRGGTYLRRVRWHSNGSLSLERFKQDLLLELQVQDSPSYGGQNYSIGQNDSQGQLVAMTTEQDESQLPLCALLPPDLQGPVKVNVSALPSIRQLEEELWRVRDGGRYRPRHCRAQQRTAVLVPYRDRRLHLRVFLRHLHPFLQRQELDYTLFVVELASGIEFNRAVLFNIGFFEALKLDNFTCFIFHDVDLLPEDDRNLYRCTNSMPRHLSVAVDIMKYKLPYATIFGGVTALTREMFEKVNGFSNLYFGWGGEDDDMFVRLRSNGYQVTRYKSEIGRYRSMGHSKADKNPTRAKLLHEGPKRVPYDGLNSLNYTVLDYEDQKLYTWILVSVDKNATMAKAALEQAKVKQQIDAHNAAAKQKRLNHTRSWLNQTVTKKQ